MFSHEKNKTASTSLVEIRIAVIDKNNVIALKETLFWTFPKLKITVSYPKKYSVATIVSKRDFRFTDCVCMPCETCLRQCDSNIIIIIIIIIIVMIIIMMVYRRGA